MKSILCFGDSNTWGFIPGSDHDRFPYDVRWPGVTAAELGNDYHVTECGLSGRTTVWEDATWPDRCGRVHLPSALDTHKPLDLVVIMLGTNDLKHHLGVNATDIASGMETLIGMVKTSNSGPDKSAPAILIVAPPPVIDEAVEICGPMFLDAKEKSLGLDAALSRVAEQQGCAYLNAGAIAVSDPADGLHLSAESHRALGRAIGAKIKETLA